jgi:hypothetical protein
MKPKEKLEEVFRAGRNLLRETSPTLASNSAHSFHPGKRNSQTAVVSGLAGRKSARILADTVCRAKIHVTRTKEGPGHISTRQPKRTAHLATPSSLAWQPFNSRAKMVVRLLLFELLGIDRDCKAPFAALFIWPQGNRKNI